MIAKIAVSAATFAIDKPYSYRVPLSMRLEPGMRVIVPFGRGNKQAEGVVLSVEAGSGEELKSVERCLDEESLLSGEMLRLAAFMRERYFCTFFDAIRVMLPGGLWFRTRESYTLSEGAFPPIPEEKPAAAAIVALLRELGGEVSEETLRGAWADPAEFREAIAYLRRRKQITSREDFLRRTGDKTEQIAELAASAEEAMDFASHRPKSAAMQRAVLELLCSVGSAPVKEICYFTGATAATVKRLEKLGYVRLFREEKLRCREIRPAEAPKELILNREQQAALEGLSQQMTQPEPGAALLYGVTGSGKTSVYIKLIARCLSLGKTAMLLVPEIALTPQLLGFMAAYFGDSVAVLHSSLPATERYDQWKRVKQGLARLVVGTRSAVFAPCGNLGLVILDEEQEHTYKSENSPRYCAREVALWRGVKEHALVLLGSATPSVETMYRAKTGVYRLYTLPNRYNGRELPSVEIVDMRQEIENGNDSAFSVALQTAIRTAAGAGKQTILFLNRRGNSRALVCVDCREAPECPRCSARLTYHSANERLMCHYCGFTQPVPKRCPRCGGPFKRIGLGTQKVQEELGELFPELAVERMDADTVNAANTHEKILERFRDSRVPILIGTQMVAKGLNLPDVTLVGVLDGDLSIYMDSYRAAETTFNMLTQVIGRAGRGDSAGRAVIQTMVPEHRVIQLAARQDYDGFYEMEIALRRLQGCPPFGDAATISFSGPDEARVLRGAAVFRDSLSRILQNPAFAAAAPVLLGPAPCPVPKINYNYRYRLSFRCKRLDRELRRVLAELLRQFLRDGANRGVSAFVDVNGYD